ncbi:MAG TPA: phosphatidylserine decarboxylase [Candidatus Fimimorpha excrementavium]|nr:phosphatidylserine decarboxylase [Candidatus Fimimorpha excrementavium]
MKYAEWNGRRFEAENGQDRLLEKLYTTRMGRILLKPLTGRMVSRLGGKLLDTSISRIAIRPFVRANGIVMEDYRKTKYRSYNDFFTRQIKPEKRPFSKEPCDLISPCDGKVSVYSISEHTNFKIKHTWYSVRSLLRNPKLAARYKGGTCVVFRLTVDDYHRYCYVDDGHKGKNHAVPGVFHTVHPVANDFVPVFKENSRVYTTLYTEHFGPVVQVEVGALMVGRIHNYHGECDIRKGMEKGRFEFGGSTIILLLQKDRVNLDSRLWENTLDGYETKVKMGETIGTALGGTGIKK